MDSGEAATVLHDHLQQYRRSSYPDLVALLDIPQVAELRGPSGATYQLEVVVHWDDAPGGALRIIGAIDDGGWRACLPLTEGFTIAPDGRFVGD